VTSFFREDDLTMNCCRMSRRAVLPLALLVFSCALLLSLGCGMKGPAERPVQTPGDRQRAESYRVNGKWYHPATDASGFQQTGIASWYGDPFHGRRTANGEVYNMHARTAAHKTLPMGTFVLVRSLDSGKETVVRINDRGPFVRGRIIDLSHRAASDLGMIGPGTARVEIIAMERGLAGKEGPGAGSRHEDFYTGDFTIQLGAFVNRRLAEKLCRRVPAGYGPASVTELEKDGRRFYRVRVGRFNSLSRAEEVEVRLIREGYTGAFAVSRN
jgi:rare lipoprotein A